MKSLRTAPLLLALLPLLATAAPADEADGQSKITRLAPVRATTDGDDKPRDAGIDGWGTATPRDTPAAVRVVGRQQLDDRLLAGQQSVHRQFFSFQIHHAAALFVHSVAADRIFSRFDCRFVPILPLLLRLWFSLLLRL